LSVAKRSSEKGKEARSKAHGKVAAGSYQPRVSFRQLPVDCYTIPCSSRISRFLC